MDRATGNQVNNINRVVAKLGHEQPLPSEIHRHMVNPAGHVWKRDGALEDQWRLGLARACRGGKAGERGAKCQAYSRHK
jgi:hypothetical protein